jgi:hypothetical protein
LRLTYFARLFFFARQDAKAQRGFLCGSSALRELFFFAALSATADDYSFFSFLVRQRILSSAAEDLFFYADLEGKMTQINAG